MFFGAILGGMLYRRRKKRVPTCLALFLLLASPRLVLGHSVLNCIGTVLKETRRALATGYQTFKLVGFNVRLAN